jgi:hypothetical protein
MIEVEIVCAANAFKLEDLRFALSARDEFLGFLLNWNVLIY